MDRLSGVYWSHIALYLSNTDAPHLLRACPAAWRETKGQLPVHWHGKLAPPPRRGPLQTLTFEGVVQHKWKSDGCDEDEEHADDHTPGGGAAWGSFRVRITRLVIRADSFPRLRALNVRNTQVRSIACLRHCPLLEELNCDYTPLRDLDGLQACARLRALRCAFTHVCSLSPLTELTELRYVSAHHTKVASLLPLRRCRALRALRAGHTCLPTLHGLERCADMVALECAQWAPQLECVRLLERCAALRSININIESRLRAYSRLLPPGSSSALRLAPLRALRHLRELRMVGHAPDDFVDSGVLQEAPELELVQCSRALHAPLQEIARHRAAAWRRAACIKVVQAHLLLTCGGGGGGG